MIRTSRSILLISLFLVVSGQHRPEGLWPLVTPLLGVSDECFQASKLYIEALSEAFTSTGNESLSEEQKNAVQMFDSNGMFPFLQEGRLQDVTYVDLCDSVLLGIDYCKATVPAELRWLRLPLGNANGPGSEPGCRAAGGSKYCHNYYQFYIPLEGSSQSSFKLEHLPPLNPKQNLDRFNVGRESPRLLFNTSLLSLDIPSNPIHQSSKLDMELQLDHSKLLNLPDLLIERSSYFSEARTQLTTLYENPRLFPQQQRNVTLDQLVAVWVFLWLQVNFLNGVGEFGFSFPVAYQGMCYPSACSVEDITRNSLSFGQGWVVSSPLINEGLGNLFDMTGEQAIQASVGCSDRDIYSGAWKTENYVVVTILAIIGFFVLLGTVLDYNETNKNIKNQNIGYQILKAFSLEENIKFVFEAPAKGGTGRFQCLEGMRSLSMTW